MPHRKEKQNRISLVADDNDLPQPAPGLTSLRMDSSGNIITRPHGGDQKQHLSTDSIVITKDDDVANIISSAPNGSDIYISGEVDLDSRLVLADKQLSVFALGPNKLTFSKSPGGFAGASIVVEGASTIHFYGSFIGTTSDEDYILTIKDTSKVYLVDAYFYHPLQSGLGGTVTITEEGTYLNIYNSRIHGGETGVFVFGVTDSDQIAISHSDIVGSNNSVAAFSAIELNIQMSTLSGAMAVATIAAGNHSNTLDGVTYPAIV